MNYLPYPSGKSRSQTAGMHPQCVKGGCVCFSTVVAGSAGSAGWHFEPEITLFFLFFFCYILWQLDKYSVNPSVTVTMVTRYFFILHNQQCHDGGGRVGVGGWSGLWGLLWGVQCDVGQGSLLVGSAPFRLLPLSVIYVQKAIKMLLKWSVWLVLCSPVRSESWLLSSSHTSKGLVQRKHQNPVSDVIVT